MGKKRGFLVMLLVLALALTGAFAGGEKEGAAGSEEVYNVRMSSAEVDGDFMTVWANNFADYMREETDGRMNIEVYPYGTLGGNRDIVELTQIGVTELVSADYGWLAAFIPEVQVLSLHYIWPKERIGEVMDWVVNNGEIMAFLEEGFRNYGLVPLSIQYEGWQWLTSKPKATKLAEFKGLKTRVMPSKMLVEDYRAYGMSPTPMAYGEIYSGLQTGLIDAQLQPLFANYSMGFWEVTNYFTQMWAEPFLGIPTVNMQWFDSLPEDIQALMRSYYNDNVIASAEWIDERHTRERKEISEKRPDIVWTEWDETEIAKAKEMARVVWEEKYPEISGERGPQALEILLKDIEDAKAALGIK
ncbi:MAG: TRAP transporter substrate-binding protein DctP [Spirochaetales bacterium]|nr:TRAP transporter substrate-binding protein DctP [Spirochaetales bacterium]